MLQRQKILLLQQRQHAVFIVIGKGYVLDLPINRRDVATFDLCNRCILHSLLYAAKPDADLPMESDINGPSIKEQYGMLKYPNIS
mmetsp:Transcript_12654/g.21821  ORF Transcript_12654/g.21821 Transcript_12654/m.21821 type:complete len:85 (+) Transcript_12654:131-385(+)